MAEARRWRRRVLTSIVVASTLVGCSNGEARQPEATTGGTTRLVAEGAELYGATCAACHGADLRGTASGPPFLDRVYAPDHHPDGAFYVAAEFGVQEHHIGSSVRCLRRTSAPPRCERSSRTSVPCSATRASRHEPMTGAPYPHICASIWMCI